MFRTWTMPVVSGGVVTVRDGGTGATGSVSLSEAQLAAWLGDPVTRGSVLQMFEAVSAQPIPASGVVEPEVRRWVIEALQHAFRRARLVAMCPMPAAPGRSGGAPATGASRAERPTPAPPPSPQKPRALTPKKTWIEIVLVDADDHPIARERCLLRLPDGSERIETLDDEGRLRVDGIDPGRCEITFPDRDGPEWRAA